MKIASVLEHLESIAPLSLQEDYDNAGLLVGEKNCECTGIITTLDVTEDSIREAVQKKCNLVVAHHPIIFKALKKLSGAGYVERTIIAAIQNNIAIYAIHTNLDNVINGVSHKMAEKIGLQKVKILLPKKNQLKKLVTFSPKENAEQVRTALFQAGGQIGNYSECSFNIEGTGTFKPGENADPYLGEIGKRHEENEVRTEIIFKGYLQKEIVSALLSIHPYEEVAYDIYSLENEFPDAGSGVIGGLPAPITGQELLLRLKEAFQLAVIRYSPMVNRSIQKIAVCGGSGSFLISAAIAAGADAYVTGDVKYHDFFDADSKILLADIGHFESEQFTIELLTEILKQKFSNFAVLKTEVKTNPVHYFI